MEIFTENFVASQENTANCFVMSFEYYAAYMQ